MYYAMHIQGSSQDKGSKDRHCMPVELVHIDIWMKILIGTGNKLLFGYMVFDQFYRNIDF